MNECTIYKVVDFVIKRWTLLVLLEIYKGKDKWKRYSKIKAKLPGITAKILSLRLKELEKENIIKKRVDSSIYPIKSEYSLTKSGEEFIKVIQSLKKWALNWKVKNKSCGETECRICELER